MTAKRFKLVEHLPNVIKIEDNNQKLNSHKIVDLLNELNDKCEVLEIDNESLEDGVTKYTKLYHESLKENEQLRKENKRLKELVEYFADELKIDLGELEE